MPVQTIATIKNWFRTGLKPTQQQFWDWLDSFVHKTDSIDQTQVNGLTTTLAGLATTASVDELKGQSTTISTSTGTIALPAGTILAKLRIKSNSAIAALNVGTTAGGNQILAAESIAANTAAIYSLDIDIENATTLHFSGLAGTVTIKTYLLR